MECQFYISTYIINLPERTERRIHMENQFAGREEFELHWIEACRHPIGAVGLWQSIVGIIREAKDKDEDAVLICEDDHCFTEHYSAQALFDHITDAHRQGAELLSGGIGNFGTALPVAPSRFWVNWYWSNQFIIIYKRAYDQILNYSFNTTDTADGVLSDILKVKMVIWPFISVQKNFGYSDATPINQNEPSKIERYFETASGELSELNAVHRYFEAVNSVEFQETADPTNH